MPKGRRPQSDRQAAHNKSVEKESAVIAATAQYREDRDHLGSANKAALAAQYEIPRTTLSARLNGRRSVREANAEKRCLTFAEEEELVRWIENSADRAIPVSARDIRERVNRMRKDRLGPDAPPVGKNWVSNFTARHSERIKKAKTSPLDSTRARYLNPTSVKTFYTLVEGAVKGEVTGEGPLKPGNIYAMDETGFLPNTHCAEDVFTRRGNHTQHKTVDADRENMTAVCTICASGNPDDSPPPLVIYKADNWPQDCWGMDSKARNPEGLP